MTAGNKHKREVIQNLAKQLKLPVLARYDEYIDTGTKIDEGLLSLLQIEIQQRRLRGIERRIIRAGFPYLKTMDNFETDRLPHLRKDQVEYLVSGKFIHEKRNAVAIGNPGTGKTHLFIAIGIEAIKKGYTVRFWKASNLITEMMEAQKNNNLRSCLKATAKCDLLILDEMGYLSFNAEGASMLFQVFADRYETKSTLVTTNLEFSKWVQFLGDPMLATALIDRLAHKSVFLNMNGPSYRYQAAMADQEQKA
jgi:DNA replication protein DnaC